MKLTQAAQRRQNHFRRDLMSKFLYGRNSIKCKHFMSNGYAYLHIFFVFSF